MSVVAGWRSQVPHRAHTAEIAGSNPAPAIPRCGASLGLRSPSGYTSAPSTSMASRTEVFNAQAWGIPVHIETASEEFTGPVGTIGSHTVEVGEETLVLDRIRWIGFDVPARMEAA